MLVFHVKRGGLGMVLGCISPPLLVVVWIDVLRETIPLVESILLVAPPCFTWNIGIFTSNETYLAAGKRWFNFLRD